MTESVETQSVAEAQPSDSDSELGKLKSQKEELVEQRNKLKQRAQQLESDLAVYKSAESEREHEAKRKAGQFEAIEADYSKQLGELRGELEAQAKAMASLQMGLKRSRLAELVAKKVGAPHAVLEDLLFAAEHRGDFELPEDISDKAVDAVVKMVNKRSPELLKPAGFGGAQASPTDTHTPKSKGEDIAGRINEMMGKAKK